MAKRPCARPGCPELVPKGYCEAHAKAKAKAADAVRVRNPWDSWYKTARWQASRAGYMRNHPLCADPFGEHEIRVVAAKDLDHITPMRVAFEQGGMVLVSKMFWNFERNVQGLCHSCHSRKTSTEDGGFGHKGNRINAVAGGGQISAAFTP